MIHVHVVPNLLEPAGRETSALAWRPGLTFADAVPAAYRDAPGLIVARGCQRVHDLSAPLHDRDHVLVARTPGELNTAQLLFLLVASTALSAALAPRLPVVERGDERSPTYGFSGITPTRAEGQPIPSYYGRIRVGGQVIGEFVQSRGPLGSWYNVLVSLGHGPIQSVAGVTEDTDPDAPLRSDGPEELRVPGTLFINDTPATDYDGVELHVRLGTAEQLPIPGFGLDEQTTTIDAPLTGPPSSGALEYLLPFWPLSPGGTTGAELADEDETWDVYGVAQSILDREVDHFTVVTELPQGLYTISSSGAPSEYSTSIAVRYIELDGGGAPITTGGPHGDGYVRLRPTPLYRAEVQGPFSLDYQFPLYDPQTYVLPSRSKLLSFDLGNVAFLEAWCDRTAGLNYPASWTAGSTTAAVSAEWWAVLRPNGANTGSTNSALGDAALAKPAPVLDLLDTATNRGFRVVYRLQQFQVAAGQFRSRIVPVVQVGNGSAIKDYHDRNTSGQNASSTADELGDARWRGTIHFVASLGTDTNGPQYDWAYGAFTYEPNAVDSLDRLRIYCDGELIVEILDTIDLTLPAAATDFQLGRRTGSTSVNQEYLKGHLDEVLLWSRPLTSGEVRASFNSGSGTYHSSATDVVAGWQFEESPAVTGDGGSVADFTGNGNTLTTHLPSGLANNLRVGSLLGIMEKAQGTNTIKRARYRVEVMRALKDVTTTSRVDDVRWALLRTHVDEQLSFPGQALMAVRVKAQDQLSGSRPEITVVVEGRQVPVWDGASASSPSFTRAYSRSPAWVLADLHLDKIAGLGRFFGGRQLDVASFQELADYAAELVYDLRGDRREFDGVLGPVGNILYDGAAYGGLGQLQVVFIDCDPPVHLVAGTYVGFHGVNDPTTDPGSVFQDINVPTVRGFLVVENLTAAQFGSTGGVLRLQYQPDLSLPYAAPPWGGAGDLGVAVQPDPITGTLEGREPRFLFDGAVDTQRDASEVLQQVVTTCRTIILREGSRVRLRVLKPEDVVDLVGQTQEIRDTFEIAYGSPKQRPNAYTASILDEGQLWDRAPVTLEDPSVAGGSDLGTIRSGSMSYEGVTRRSQAQRLLQFLLNCNRLCIRSGSFEASVDTLALEVADVVQVAHDCVPRGTSGRVEASSGPGAVTLDRTFELEGGKTYDLSVRTLGGGYSTRTVTSPAGTYVAAVDELEVAPDFDVQPEKGQAVILCEQGLELRARVKRLSLTKDMKRSVEWTEEQADAFATDEYGETRDLPSELALAEEGFGLSRSRPPADVLDLSVHERLVRAPGGASLPHVALTWRHDPATLQLVARTEVSYAVEAGPWRPLGVAQGAAEQLLARLPDARPGTRLRFAVAPVGLAGARRSPDRVAIVRLPVYAVASAPPGPTELAPTLSGSLATYRVAPGDVRAGLAHELRAGGWILGQPLAFVPAGQESAQGAAWLLGAENAAGDLEAPLVARGRAPEGSASEAVVVDDFAPVPEGYADLDDLDDATLTEQAWEDYGEGWTWVTEPLPVPNSTLADLQVNAEGELEFAGSALSGTFETPDPTAGAVLIGKVTRLELVHLSAFAVGEQVHPLTWMDASFTWDEAEQFSFEGPISDLGDPEDAGQCSLRIYVRLLRLDGTWGDWQDYRPGTAACVAAQFRLTVTRPSADFQVRVQRFSTRLVRQPEHKDLRSPLQTHLEARALRRRG